MPFFSTILYILFVDINKSSSQKKKVSIDNMQFGFMPGKGTTDAIFIMRQVQEKHQAKKKKKLYYTFVDLEKAFESTKRGGEMGFAEAGCG